MPVRWAPHTATTARVTSSVSRAAVRDRTAVGVGARRSLRDCEELLEQVAVGPMDLDAVEAGRQWHGGRPAR
jgi:hypothetical protein